ncbi:MAG: hypothetical protein IKE24_08565 [Clostridia bacterium]|nr:hypothetical protein [Clostridia bacterium]
MQKKALLALMLAMTLFLTGCTLVQKDPEVDRATEIIRLGDQVITKGEVTDTVNSQLEYMASLYSMYGLSYDAAAAENIAEVRSAVIADYKTHMVETAKIKELGLDTLTEEEEAAAQADAEQRYQDNLDHIISDNEDLADLTDEEKQERAKEQLDALDYTMETALEDARHTILEDKLRAKIIKDVAVTEEEIQADFDSKVESARTTYENNAGSWASAANNGTSPLYYTPAGVRYVKQILVGFTDEDQAAIDAANAKVTEAQTAVTAAESKMNDAQAVIDREDASEEDQKAAEGDLNAAQEELTQAQSDLAAAQAEVNAATDTAFANIDSAADEILAQLAEGADWDTLMAEKTEDPGMLSGITAQRGYAVSADMTSFDSAFVQAAMALEKIGDVSDKTKGTTYGYYIIKYVGDAAEGPIALEEVRETIESSLLSTKQDTTYNEQIEAWVSEMESQFKVDEKALD